MNLLLYRSVACVAPRSDGEARIWLESRHNNASAAITGHLHREGDWFVQAVEGSSQAIDALFGRLRRDPRHRAMAVLRYGAVSHARLFAHWRMGFGQGPGAAPYAGWDGGDIGTAEGERLLAFLQAISKEAGEDHAATAGVSSRAARP